MHNFSCGLIWFERQGNMPQTNFPIFGNFYQENMAENSNLLDLFDIKLSTQMWSINRSVYIIEAGQSFLLKISSRYWKNSAKITWNKWSIVCCYSKLILMWQLHMDLSCLVRTYSLGFLLPVGCYVFEINTPLWVTIIWMKTISWE